MNIDQIKKHGEVMKWFIDNPVKGVWAYFHENEGWVLTYNPQWCEDSIYVQNDGYSNLRKPQAEGKTIEYQYGLNNSSGAEWRELHTPCHFEWGRKYRIKPDIPKFKLGDWVIYDNQPEYELGQWSLKFEQSYMLNNNKESYRLWKPTKDELCVFWNNEASEYIIRKARNSHLTQDEYCVKWDNIAPLEFIQTLKGK